MLVMLSSTRFIMFPRSVVMSSNTSSTMLQWKELGLVELFQLFKLLLFKLLQLWKLPEHYCVDSARRNMKLENISQYFLLVLSIQYFVNKSDN